MRRTDPNLIYPDSVDAPQAMPGEEMDMPKRPNKRVPPESEQTIPERKEEMAADRLPEQERYPYNNFALTALVLAGLIILIGLAYVTGMVK